MRERYVDWLWGAAGLAAVLLLSDCDGLPRTFTGADRSRIDVADVNGRNALARVEALEGRVEELEAKLDR